LEILVECWLLVGGSEIIWLVMMVVVIGTGVGEILVVRPNEPWVILILGVVVGVSWILVTVGVLMLGVWLLERFLGDVGEFLRLVTIEAREILGVGILVWSHFEFWSIMGPGVCLALRETKFCWVVSEMGLRCADVLLAVCKSAEVAQRAVAGQEFIAKGRFINPFGWP
jgi:hypothetical protein